MPSPIDVLPAELFIQVVKYLRHHDLAHLMRVSREFNKLIEPVLWTKIELHRKGYHEASCFKELRQEEGVLDRPYQEPPKTHILKWGEREQVVEYTVDNQERDFGPKITAFLDLFSERSMTDRKRAEHLAGLVRWLCIPVNGFYTLNGMKRRPVDPWNALAMFTNLEYLDISGFWGGKYLEILPFNSPEHSMAKLQTLKLHGYIPKEFVQYACRSASTITELHLAVLDKPIGSSLCHKVPNPPPYPKPDNDYEVWDKYSMIPEDVRKKYNVENLDHEVVAPRPLACLTSDIKASFTCLKKLYLFRPSSAFIENRLNYGEIYHSEISDDAILDEWEELLLATRNTLEHVAFDQRPVGNECEPDGTSNTEFMHIHCNGFGYDQFVETILPLFLEGRKTWPELKSVKLFGLEWDENHASKWEGLKPRGKRSVHVDRQIQEALQVEVLSAIGRRIITDDSTGEIMSGGHMLETGYNSTEEEDEDEEDEE